MRTGLYRNYPNPFREGHFAGYEMAIDFGSPREEHIAVRTSSGFFDISHMGTICIPESCIPGLDTLFTNKLSQLQTGDSCYGFFCNNAGGVIDDCIIYKPEPNIFLLISNAANKHAILSLLQENELQAAHLENHCIIALQGPDSSRVCNSVLPGLEGIFSMPDLPAKGKIVAFNTDSYIAATGYTGEKGFEFILPDEVARTLWTTLCAHSQPCGLAARDSLRLEAGLPLHGHELGPDISPIACGLEQFIDFSKDSFTGKKALLEEAKNRTIQIWGLEIEKAMPRPGYPLIDVKGNRIGRILSGMRLPKRPVFAATALIDTSLLPPGSTGSTAPEVYMTVRGQKHKVKKHSKRFLQRWDYE